MIEVVECVCAHSEWCKLFLAAAQGAEGMQASLARASDMSDLDAMPMDEPGSGVCFCTLHTDLAQPCSLMMFIAQGVSQLVFVMCASACARVQSDSAFASSADCYLVAQLPGSTDALAVHGKTVVNLS